MNIELQEIPEETRRIAIASFPKGNNYLRLRDESGPLFQDEAFRDLYSWKGADEVPSSYLATITVLQYAEGLSDRQAAEQVRSRIDWKYLLGVEITYAGFHYSALNRFRERLLSTGAEERLFELPLTRMRELGLVSARGRQRTDSTHVLAQIRTLNRLELVGESLRQALNEIAILAPEWLTSWVPSAWFERYGTRIEEAKLPQDESQRAALVTTIGQDGYQLLSALARPDAPPYLRESIALHVLHLVWIQQFYGPDRAGEWRKATDLPPACKMINSPYDPDAQYSRKRKMTWTGYKAHLSESCDDDRPHLITHVETTPATEPDCVTLPTIHMALAAKALLPAEHLIDAGYMNIDNLVNSRQSQQIELIGPMRPDSSRQARTQNGYDIAHFVIDWDAETVTCPQGKASTLWSPSTNKQGDDSISVRFDKQTCLACPVHQLCTTAATGARGLRLQPTQLLHDSLQQARHLQRAEHFHETYRSRAGVEGTISQATRTFELRLSRFVGFAKTRLQHLATATAINLARLNDWWLHSTRAQTRTSAFLELNLPVS